MDLAGAWTNVGDVYNCTWTPPESDVNFGLSYTQTGNWKQDRTNINRHRLGNSSGAILYGEPIQATQTVAPIRASSGTWKGRWAATTNVLTSSTYSTAESARSAALASSYNIEEHAYQSECLIQNQVHNVFRIESTWNSAMGKYLYTYVGSTQKCPWEGPGSGSY